MTECMVEKKKKYEIYLDNTLLVRWIKHVVRMGNDKSPKRIFDQTFLKFIFDHSDDIQGYFSIISVLELINSFSNKQKHQKFLSKHNAEITNIIKAMQTVQKILNLRFIKTTIVKKIEVDGVLIQEDTVDMALKRPHIRDCMHIDIAKQNKLIFVTNEIKAGLFKEYYNNIMTENKFRKQKFI